MVINHARKPFFFYFSLKLYRQSGNVKHPGLLFLLYHLRPIAINSKVVNNLVIRLYIVIVNVANGDNFALFYHFFLCSTYITSNDKYHEGRISVKYKTRNYKVLNTKSLSLLPSLTVFQRSF